MAEITKAQLVERERSSWDDLMKRMEFLAELVCAKTDRTLLNDAGTKVNDALLKYKQLFKQRIVIEFPPKL